MGISICRNRSSLCGGPSEVVESIRTKGMPAMLSTISATEDYARLEQQACSTLDYTSRNRCAGEAVCKIAASREERKAAFRLVYGKYLRSNLCEPNEWQMRVTPYHLQPTTDVINASVPDGVTATLTLVRDGHLGLPMEGVFGAEVARRRAKKLHLAEVSSLACKSPRMTQILELVPVHGPVCYISGGGSDPDTDSATPCASIRAFHGI